MLGTGHATGKNRAEEAAKVPLAHTHEYCYVDSELYEASSGICCMPDFSMKRLFLELVLETVEVITAVSQIQRLLGRQHVSFA